MYNASLMAFQSGDYEESIKWSNELMHQNPSDVRFHVRLIDGYDELGDLDLPLEAIKNARKYVPQSKIFFRKLIIIYQLVIVSYY